MEAHANGLTGIAIVTAAAVVAGLTLQGLRQPPIIGYILTGVVLGPSGVGLVTQSEQVSLLAELGVVLLLFLIGMELSLKAFVRVLRPSILTAIGQIASGLAIAYLFGWWLDWSAEQSLLIGFVVAMSSTAVAIQMLEDIGELRSDIGQVAIGVLIAQDIAVVPMLIFIDSFGYGHGVNLIVALKIAIAIGLLAAFIYALSRRGKFAIPFATSIVGRVDLLTLSTLGICFVAASASGVAGLSPAYGAFLAGLAIANSHLRSQAIHVAEPIQSVLLVVFFLSIGLLIDVRFVWNNIGSITVFVVGVIALKSALNVWLLRLVGQSWENAFPAGLVMAQIGEFSFVLAAVGFSNRAISAEGYRFAIAVIAISLLVSPFWMSSVRRFHTVAQHGVTSFRDALAEVYAEEISEIERGSAVLGRFVTYLSRQFRAARLAWTRRRSRTMEASGKSETTVSSSGDGTGDRR